MADVAAVPKNGLTVVSTFSGCGGSCLGFEMAGYTVRWASEFVPAAAEVYRLNHPGVPLDTRDVRQVTPEEILAAAGLAEGELDVLEGSPPCASFSTAGKRSANWGQEKAYSDTSQRVDDLFFEYARLLRGLQPRAFVAENVSGLVKGVAKGYFKLILAELQSAGYRVEARLLDAQWLGVPQMRQRIIFQGVRSDLDRSPAFPSPLPYRYSVRDALPDIFGVEHPAGYLGHPMLSSADPAPTVLAERTQHATALVGVGTSKGERSSEEPSPTVMTHGNRYTRSELTVVERRTFAERDALRVTDGMPLGPAVGREWDKLRPGEQSERYFSLTRPSPDRPSGTVTAVGGTDAAGVAHPTERRKFSIAELRRICAFPDDFVLTGTYAQQWERLGRAVPPLMMRAVAESLRDVLL